MDDFNYENHESTNLQLVEFAFVSYLLPLSATPGWRTTGPAFYRNRSGFRASNVDLAVDLESPKTWNNNEGLSLNRKGRRETEKELHLIHHGNLGWICLGRKFDANTADGVDVMRTSIRPYHARHLHHKWQETKVKIWFEKPVMCVCSKGWRVHHTSPSRKTTLTIRCIMHIYDKEEEEEVELGGRKLETIISLTTGARGRSALRTKHNAARSLPARRSSTRSRRHTFLSVQHTWGRHRKREREKINVRFDLLLPISYIWANDLRIS